MNLYAQHNFTVVRQIANHTDETTYYVRAVIRNAYTDETIDTLDLEDKGGQRFKKNWRVPADPSGEGFYISIVTSVYTDSGYTTKSADYGDEENTYLVTTRNIKTGGGSSLGLRDVRDIVKEELSPISEAITALKKLSSKTEKKEKPKEVPMRWDEILSAINKLAVVLKPKDPQRIDLKPIVTAIADVKKAVKDKEVTPKTDLKPLNDQLDKSIGKIMAILEKVGEGLIKTAMEGIREELQSVQWESTYVTKAKKGETPKMERVEADKEEEEPFDINSLSL